MLAEALHTLLSLPGTPAGYRRYVPGAVGLWARGRRQAKVWAPHLERTRAAILKAMPEGRRMVVVLGSGPLFDVPLSELCAAFRHVLLVDLVHLWSARRHAPANAAFLSLDLSAGLNGMPPADWVISVNLLSQLAHGAPDGEERAVVDRHLGDLARLDAKVTLVTDTSYRVLDRPGHIVETVDLLYGRTLPPPAARWEWEVAPFGEEHADRRRIHEVGVWPDWTAVAQGR
jgi:hypothetical protein